MQDSLPPPPTLEATLSQGVEITKVIQNDHAYQLGKQHGVRQGSMRRAWELRHELARKAAKLDSLMPFATLLITEQGARQPDASATAWIVPPVLSEARGEVTTVSDGQRLQLTEATYRIEVQPRYVTQIPTWRDYVLPNLIALEAQPKEMGYTVKPDDRSKWSAGVRDGWSVGIKLAEENAAAGLQRAARDWAGMSLYHSLRAQGLVSPPLEKSETTAAATNGSALVIGQRTFTIVAASAWNPNTHAWTANSDAAGTGSVARGTTTTTRKMEESGGKSQKSNKTQK